MELSFSKDEFLDFSVLRVQRLGYTKRWGLDFGTIVIAGSLRICDNVRK